MGAFLDVAGHAIRFRGYLQAGLQSRVSIPHDLFVHVLAAGAVAGLALNTVLKLEGVVLLPVLGQAGGSVAAEADGRFLGILPEAADRGYLLRFRPRET